MSGWRIIFTFERKHDCSSLYGTYNFPRLSLDCTWRVTELGRAAMWRSSGKGQGSLEGWPKPLSAIHHVPSQPQGMNTWLGPPCPPPASGWQLGANSHSAKSSSVPWQASTCLLATGQVRVFTFVSFLLRIKISMVVG